MEPTLKTTDSLSTIRLDFAGKYAQESIEASPIGYARMLNSAVAPLPLVTLAALFRALIRDFSSITRNQLKLWRGRERKWSGPLVICLTDMSFSLFLKPDVVPDLGPRRCLSSSGLLIEREDVKHLLFYL